MSEPTRRFYQAAEAVAHEGGFAVTLDGRALRTPGRLAFVVPTRALADLCAAEWAAQTDVIRPMAMPVTRLANVAIERAKDTRAALAEGVAKYAETDLLCHRAGHPQRLVERQAAAWDPLLEWAAAALGVRLHPVAGISADQRNIAAVAPLQALAGGLDDFRLTGLAHASGLTGSCILAIALLRGRLDGAAAAGLASLDEEWSLETWGEDAEARDRLVRLAGEIAAVDRFFRALG